MAKDCAEHAGTPSIAACSRCKKPLCKSCVVMTRAGTFCSTTCNLEAKEAKDDATGPKKKGGGAGKLLILIILGLVSGMFLLHFAVRGLPSDHVLRKIDLIGQLLKRR